MRNKFRVLSIFLAVILAFSAALNTVQAETDITETAYNLIQSQEIEIPVFSADNMKMFDIPDNEALRFTRSMKLGWNLGNTFDAYNGYTNYYSGISMETSWVGAKTRQELITAISKAGFSTIRIPVSWHNHVDENDMIDPEWMERVKEVAGWALDLGMYVIINVHHDNNVRYFYPDSAHYERSEQYLASVWKQIAEAFREYDDHLILESMNEPRLVDTSFEWSFNPSASQCIDAAECINLLNQKFVDIIRASGGNNETRYLMVPAYCGSPWYACNSAFKLPEDSADNRLILEAHAYTPYDFALNPNSQDKSFDLDGDQNKKSEISQFMNELYKRYIANGIPVVIDEFGARDRSGNLQDRVNFAAYYVASASTRGITCCWWDNHIFMGTGERFGIIDRSTVQWKYPDIALAMLQNCLLNRE